MQKKNKYFMTQPNTIWVNFEKCINKVNACENAARLHLGRFFIESSQCNSFIFMYSTYTCTQYKMIEMHTSVN